MPSRLRPTAPLATDAILVGDPGRALMLAQALLEQPKMSNHARGLWGYSGVTPEGAGLTIQATGMGGPSAAVVLADLAKLGVRRAIRVGTCAGVVAAAHGGELLLASGAIAFGGSAAAFGAGPEEEVLPDRDLYDQLLGELGDGARPARVGSFDAIGPEALASARGVEVADMQTVAILARGRELGIAVASLLVVGEASDGGRVPDDEIEAAAKRAGEASRRVLSA